MFKNYSPYKYVKIENLKKEEKKENACYKVTGKYVKVVSRQRGGSPR